MRILDNYILNKVVLSYILLIFCFVGLYIIVDLFSNLADFLTAKTSPLLILTYYFYSLPLMFLTTSPFALPISILYALGELNRNNEIVTMRSSGISVFRIASPIIFFALFLSVFSFSLQEKVLINTQRKVMDIKMTSFKKHRLNTKEIRNFVFQDDNKLFFVSRLNLKENIMTTVEIFKKDKNGDIREKMVCNSMVYINGQWKGYGIITYIITPEGAVYEEKAYEDKDIELHKTPQEIVLARKTFGEYVSFKSLYQEIKRIRRLQANISSSRINNLTIELNKKVAEPFNHLFLVVGILPFALEIKKRKVGLFAIGGGVIFGFMYYLLFSISIALGKAGVIIPSLSAWTAPLFFLVVGVTGLVLLR